MFKFFNYNIYRFILLLRGVYPQKYMNGWERFNEKTLPKKEEFYNNLNLEDIIDQDYMHGTRGFKYFKRKHL